MRLVETVWTPDTGGGRFVFEWDADLPADQRVHTFKRTERDDGLHGLQGDALYLAALGDNQRKNLMLKMAEQNGLAVESWSFDSSRILHVTLPDARPQDRSFLQGAADTQFGPGRVIVDG